MANLRQLSKEEVLFIAGETHNSYQHTAGLAILDASAAPNFSFESFRERIIQRIEQVPQFRWKLQEVPMSLDLPYWVEDENFDYKHHFKRIAVPSPGDRVALAELVAHLYNKHMDRSKPLWEVWFIEGLADGKFAMLQKSHHCMMDGEGASQLSQVLSDLEPDAEPRPVDESITSARPGAVPSLWQMSANATLHLWSLPVEVSRSMASVLRTRFLKQLGRDKNVTPEKPEVPATPLNGEVGRERGFVFGSVSLADIKTVKDAFGASVNDVVLALVGSSLRNYLLALGELPEAPLRSIMIVSLRTEEDDSFSNKVTSTSVSLATDVDDPVARLQAIHEETLQVKQRARQGGVGIIEIIQLMPPLLVNALVSATPAEMGRKMAGGNLVVSNVRSSPVPIYMAGARLEAVHPMSIISQGLGINLTCVSYAGKVGFGVTIDPDLVPHPWDIADGIAAALQEYLALAGKATERGKIAAKKKPARKKARLKKTVSSKKKTVSPKKKAISPKKKAVSSKRKT